MPQTAHLPLGDLDVRNAVQIVVTDDIRQMFDNLVVKGTGGYQNLSRTITERLATGDPVLHFSAEEFRRVVRYATTYGDGTFQRRLRVLVTQWVAQNFGTLVAR
jgi:hypothetical protein